MKRILFINPPVVCVNECQRGWYSFAHPTSILKLIAWHLKQGYETAFIDCMDYEVDTDKPLRLYKKLPIGTGSLNLFMDTGILGKPAVWLEEELKKQIPPDEIWGSCHMTFNNALAHEAVRVAKKVFPKAKVLLGGNYATLFPEEARRKSGASVYQGLFSEAKTLFPDYSLFDGPMDYMVFQLDLGCENHCAHCVNSRLTKEIVRFDVKALVEDLRQKKERYGVRRFINIDPNVAHYDLEDFLSACIRTKLDTDLFFYGGIAPNRVTERLANLMMEAGVKGITLPRELGNEANKQMGKNYGQEHFFSAVDVFLKTGFDLSDFHCSFPVGFKDDCLIEIMTIIKEIKDMGAIPEIAPIALVPGTSEYERHRSLLDGKTLEELNWALWPTLDSTGQIAAHAAIYNAAHGNKFNRPWDLKNCSRGREQVE